MMSEIGRYVKVLLVLLVVVIGMKPVLADSDNSLDFSRKGVVSVTLSELTTGNKVSGAEVVIYKIADVYSLENNLAFSYQSCLSDYQEELEKGIVSDAVLELVVDNQVPSWKGVTNESGVVSFEKLELGLYLVVQTNQVVGYSKFEPFLVMIPQILDNKWVYEVEAVPKVDIVRLVDLSVEKVWNVTYGSEVPDMVTVCLLKKGEVVDQVVLNEENDWSYTWEQIEFSGDYAVEEVDVPTGYTVTYKQEGNKFIVTNTKELVKTGQVMWLTPMLVLIGLVFVIVGIILDKGKRYE